MTVSFSRAIVMTPRYGGADGVSAVSRVYADALTSLFAQVDVWSLDEQGQGGRGKVTGVKCARGRRLVFATYALREPGVGSRTLVVVQHVHLLPTALPLIARGARLMTVLHGIEAWTRLRPLERAACRRAWKVVAVSAHTVRRFRDANPDLAAVHVDVCAPGLPAPGAADDDNVPGPYALIVARMHAAERYKGHDDLLDVWPAVAAKVPGARLVIAGDGDDRARLEQKAASLGLGDAVRFEGVVDDRRLQALYRDAAAFAMPSPNEGFGLVFVEAMRAGVPCIAAAGAAQEIIDHERTGLIVPARDRVLLERALVRLLGDSEARTRLGGAARLACARFTDQAFAGRLSALMGSGVGMAATPLQGPAFAVGPESNVEC